MKGEDLSAPACARSRDVYHIYGMAHPDEISDTAAEQRMLGCILVDPAILGAVSAIVSPADIADPWRQSVYRAMTSLSAGGAVPDVHAVYCAMQPSSHPTHHLAWLMELADSVAGAANAQYYAGRVAAAATRRRAAAACTAGAAQLRAGDDAIPDIITTLSSITASASHESRFASMSAALMDWSTCLEAGPRQYVHTGFAMLDGAASDKGLLPGQVCVVGARPGVGKSALAANIALRAARDTRVLFVSLEMSSQEIVSRMVSATSGVPCSAFDTPSAMTPREWQAVAAATSMLSTLRLGVCATSSMLIEELASVIAAETARDAVGLIVLDYIGLICGDTSGTREGEMASVSRGIKGLAMRHNCAVLALAQLNRDATRRPDKLPTLTDLRDSGAIEQDADIVVLLHRSEEDVDRASAHVAKRRNGPCGQYQLRFHAELQRFADDVDGW